MELKLAAHHGGERGGVLPDGHHHHRVHPRVPLLPAHPCLDVRRQVEEERGGGEGSKLPPLFDFPLRRVLVETSRLSLPRRPRLAMPLPRWRTCPTTNLNNNRLPAGKLGRGRSLRPAESSRSPSTALLSHSQPLLVALHGLPSLPTPLLSPLQAALLPTLSVNSCLGLPRSPEPHNHPSSPSLPLPSTTMAIATTNAHLAVPSTPSLNPSALMVAGGGLAIQCSVSYLVSHPRAPSRLQCDV